MSSSADPAPAEGALVTASADGRIAGAALEVTAVERPPVDSPLREAPHRMLTPHAAGGRPVGADTRIAPGLAESVTGGAPQDVVDR